MDNQPLSLEWRDLSLWRGDRCLQRSLNGRLQPGQAITLRGPNGCGKTTLLRTLCGLSLPETGEVHWAGERIERVRTEFQARLAYSGHNEGLKRELSARENLAFSAALRGRHTNQNDLIAGLQLTACADLPVRSLSAGQRRRAAIAQVLGSGADLWVMDEPFTNLDQTGCEWLARRCNGHLSMGGMLVMAAHQQSWIDPARETVIELAGAAA